MVSSRRAARGAAVVGISADPNRIMQQSIHTPRGEVRAWFKAGTCCRVIVAGTVYGWGEGPAVWAAVMDGSFRPTDFGRQAQ